MAAPDANGATAWLCFRLGCSEGGWQLGVVDGRLLNQLYTTEETADGQGYVCPSEESRWWLTVDWV